jgi:hypothetical protein
MTTQNDEYRKQPPSSIFDGFCHRPYIERLDGWKMEQLESDDVPSVQMARDVIALFDEVNALRHENWELRKRLSDYESTDIFKA